MYRISLLGLFLVLFTACGAQEAAEPLPAVPVLEPSARPANAPEVDVSELVRSARTGSPALAAVLGGLPEPQRIAEEVQENRHVPGQMDTLRTYHYDGLQFTVYDVSGSDKVMLQSLRITAPGYETEGVNVGATRADVERALGPPQRQEDGAEVYGFGEAAESFLHVRYEGDAVSELRWAFYVD